MEYVESVRDYFNNVQIEAVLRPIKEVKIDRKLIADLAAAGLVGYGVYYLGFAALNIFSPSQSN